MMQDIRNIPGVRTQNMPGVRTCAKCGEEISPGRLQAMPLARLCRDCAQDCECMRLTAFSPLVQKALVMSSLGDDAEAWREAVGAREDEDS